MRTIKTIAFHLFHITAVLAFAALMPFSQDVEAASKPPTPEEQEAYQRELFKKLDHNNDSKVTEKEFVVVILHEVFVAEDKNGDGKVTKEQALAAATGSREQAEKEYAMMDTEGKGYIVFKDLFRNKPAIEELRAEWKKVDKKNKGYITLSDLPDLKE